MKKFKLILFILSSVLSVLIFTANPQIVASSVKNSLTLCFNSVIPSLFPFFIVCDFFVKLITCTSVPPNVLAFVSGLITGFPTGVKNVCTLYENGSINKSTAVSLLHCTVNASPAYIVTFIGVCILKNKSIGIILLISQCISSLVCALFFHCFKKSKNRRGKVINITETACFAVTESTLSCLYVCGYITFFGIFADILSSSDLLDGLNTQIKAIIIGLIEISRGMSMIDFSKENSVIIAGIILAFSGISVIMQCVNCCIKVKLPARAILTGKLAYMILMPEIAYTLTKLKLNITMLFFVFFILTSAVLIYYIFDKQKKKIYNK